MNRFQYPPSGLTTCTNWITGSGSVCGFPLEDLPVRPAAPEVLEVQDLFLRAAAGQLILLAGKEVAPADWFAEMSQLVALARLAGPQEFPGLDMVPELHAQAWRDDHAAEEAGRSWTWREHPPSPELMAALLHALGPVLRAASEQELRDTAAWLISAAYHRRAARNARILDPSALPPFTHPEAVAGAIAIAVAAAYAAGGPLRPGPFDRVLEHVPPGKVRDGIAEARRMLTVADPETAAYFLGNGRDVSARDTVPFTLWAAARHLADFEQAIWTTTAAGGDIDSTCAIVGGITAAGLRPVALPGVWL